jgi:predicted Zn-dependent protease
MKARFVLILGLMALCCACSKTSVYFVPVGNAPADEINDLVQHYKEKFDLKSAVLPPMVVLPRDFNSSRQQLIAESVVLSLQRDYGKYLQNNSAILIGVTGDDMYMLQQNWQFCFGWRSPDTRIAVVSTARMNLYYPGEVMPSASLTSRLRKMVTKVIGIMYYHRKPSQNPRSVLFDGILGIQELDQVSEEF